MTPHDRDVLMCRRHELALRIETQWYALHGEIPPNLVDELFECADVRLLLTGEFDA